MLLHRTILQVCNCINLHCMINLSLHCQFTRLNNSVLFSNNLLGFSLLQPREREKKLLAQKEKRKKITLIFFTLLLHGNWVGIFGPLCFQNFRKKLLLYSIFFQYHTWAQGAVCGNNTLYNFWEGIPSKTIFSVKRQFFRKNPRFQTLIFWTLAV